MPVNYVAPGPIAYRRSIYGAGDGMGGGGGGGGRAFYGPGPIVQLQDRTGEFQNRLNLAAIDATVQTNLADQRFAQQSVLARQASELNAWEFQQRVTTQESAQERADRNAIAAVDADPTMTEEEKVQAKTRIKSRIDWVSERAKRDGAQAEAQMLQSRAKMFQSEVQQNELAMKYMTGQISGKVHTLVDDDAAAEIGSAIELVMPGFKERDPEAFKRMVEKEAILQGRATRYAATEKGVVDLSKGQRFGEGGQLGRAGAGDTGGGADRGASGSRSGTRGGDPIKDSVDIEVRAMEAADKWASARQVPPTAEEWQGEFERRRSILRSAEEAARANTPEGRIRSQIADEAKKVDAIKLARNDLTNSQYLGEVGRRYAAKILDRAELILKKFPPGNRPSFVQDELTRLEGEVRQLKANHDRARDLAAMPGAARNILRSVINPTESPESSSDPAFENMVEAFPMG